MLIRSKRYPEADVYVGDAYKSTIEYKVVRFPGLDAIANRILTEAVEYEINRNGGILLETAVYSENSWWGIIPTYHIKIEFIWYPVVALGIVPLLDPITIIAIIAAAVAAIFISIAAIVYFWTNYNVTMKYGREPWYSSMFGSLTLLAIVGGGAYLLIKYGPDLYRKIYKEKKA